MGSRLLQSGLNLANYLQSAFPPEAYKDSGIPSEFDRSSPQANKPPALIASVLETGRYYFRLTHENAVNNLLSLFAPVGRMRHFVPDLYIPTVSICTFLLLRSVYIVINTDPRPSLGDILGRTMSRICLVYVVEFFILSGLLYATTPLTSPLDDFRQHSVSTDASLRSGSATPACGLEDNRCGYMGGSDRQFGASSNPFNSVGGQGLAHNQVVAHFGNAVGMGQVDPSQSQYASYGANLGTPSGAMDRHYELNSSGLGVPKSPDSDGNMTTPLSGSSPLHLPEKVFIIGYKYVLLSCYIIAILIAPIRAVTVPLGAYICATSVLFPLRIVGYLSGGHAHKGNPLIFIFPLLQPLCCYILLPHV